MTMRKMASAGSSSISLFLTLSGLWFWLVIVVVVAEQFRLSRRQRLPGRDNTQHKKTQTLSVRCQSRRLASQTRSVGVANADGWNKVFYTGHKIQFDRAKRALGGYVSITFRRRQEMQTLWGQWDHTILTSSPRVVFVRLRLSIAINVNNCAFGMSCITIYTGCDGRNCSQFIKHCPLRWCAKMNVWELSHLRNYV